MKQARNLRVGVTAFVLALTLLGAVLCAVRVECVVGRMLHDTAEAQPYRIEKQVNTIWLPPSLRTLVCVLQAEREAIAVLMNQLGSVE